MTRSFREDRSALHVGWQHDIVYILHKRCTSMGCGTMSVQSRERVIQDLTEESDQKRQDEQVSVHH